MAWIESHQELARHPKTKRLARSLEISIPAAIGHLHLLWWWSLDYAQSGELTDYTSEDIADAACWEGDPEKFFSELAYAGFIDCENEFVYIHDWNDYAGKLIERREAQNLYTKRQRALYNDLRLIKAVRARDGDTCQYCGNTVNWNDRKGAGGGTYDHILPDGENTLENIVVSCRSCNSKKGGRTPEQACMPLLNGRFPVDLMQIQTNTEQINGRFPVDKSVITVPNPTEPNSTVPSINNNININNAVNTPLPPTTGKNDIQQIWESFDFSQELKEAVVLWGKYKKERKFTYKAQGLRTLLSQVKKYAETYGDAAMIEVIEMSISNGYQGIVWDRVPRSVQPRAAPDRETQNEQNNRKLAVYFGGGDTS